MCNQGVVLCGLDCIPFLCIICYALSQKHTLYVHPPTIVQSMKAHPSKENPTNQQHIEIQSTPHTFTRCPKKYYMLTCLEILFQLPNHDKTPNITFDNLTLLMLKRRTISVISIDITTNTMGYCHRFFGHYHANFKCQEVY